MIGTSLKRFESAPGTNNMTCATCGVLNLQAPIKHFDDCAQRVAYEVEARASGLPPGLYVPDA